MCHTIMVAFDFNLVGYKCFSDLLSVYLRTINNLIFLLFNNILKAYCKF